MADEATPNSIGDIIAAPPPIGLDAYRSIVGRALGTSRWFLMDQERISHFADITLDRQFIHTDPARARDTLFGGTVAHGFLTLSLLPTMAANVIPRIEGAVMDVNYGMEALRFVAPVRSGRNIRGAFLLKNLVERRPGQWLSTVGVTVEIEGEDRPALLADWLTLAILEPEPVKA